MIKLFISPLFIFLISIVICEAIFFTGWRKLGVKFRASLLIITIATVLLWFFSLPVVTAGLAEGLEKPFTKTSGAKKAAKIDVVVVLSGGYYRGAVPGRDELNGISMSRVIAGVRTFQQCSAKLMVVTGRSFYGKPERMTVLMRDFAVAMGVPTRKIVLETKAVNTYMHPLEITKIPAIRKDDRIAVVTSAWHLDRAMKEFFRYYPNAIPVPADSLKEKALTGGEIWFPSVFGLEGSTLAIYEYVGLLWYKIKHWAHAKQ